MQKIETHEIDYKKSLKAIDDWKISPTEKSKVKLFVKDYESGKITKKIGTAQQSNIDRYLRSLRVALENCKTINKKGVEDFVSRLVKNKIQYKGKNYSVRSKKAILDIFAKYLKNRYSTKKLHDSVNLDIKEKKKDPPFLTLIEIKKLYDACPDNNKRYFIAMLFSSGCRAEEMMNIRYCDVKLPEGNDTFIEVTLRNEFSKTNGRTIKLYWDYALEGIRPFIKEREALGIKDDEPIFNITYRSMAKWLNKLGKRVLGKPVNFHLFRHSSASWLANKMNRQELCYFFGWNFSSPMPDVYISRKGIVLKDIDNTFERTNLEKIKAKLEKSENDRRLEKEKFDETMKNVKKDILRIRERASFHAKIMKRLVEVAKKPPLD